MEDEYRKLEQCVINTLKTELEENRITRRDYAKILSANIGLMLELSQGEPYKTQMLKQDLELKKKSLPKKIAILEKQLAIQTQELGIKEKQNELKATQLQLEKEVMPLKKETVRLQGEKLKADIAFTNKQASIMQDELNQNAKKIALDALSRTYSDLGAGGLVVSKDMWTGLFSLVNQLAPSGLGYGSDTGVANFRK